MKRVTRINQETLDTMLPAIPPEFENQMRSLIDRLPQQRKERPMKKKLSVGLVLALALALITVGALAAALLGGKDFVDQIMAPKAAETKEEKYTSQEVKEILRIAEENDIALPDYLVKRLNEEKDGYYKEELMRVFVKTEYGFYPSAWPIEVQHWYEEMLEACGLGDGHISAVLPEENEISQDKAVEIAMNYIHSNLEKDADLTNEQLYLRHMTYYETVVNPYVTTREWSISYEARDPYHTNFYLTLTPQGEIASFRSIAGIYGSSSEMAGQFIGDRFTWAYGDQYGFVNWTSELMLEYQKALRMRADKNDFDWMTVGEKHILKQQYVLPDETMLTREAAIEAAKKACGDLPYSDSSSNRDAIAICLQDQGLVVWKVTLAVEGQSKIGYVYAQLDAHTGETLGCDISLSQGNSSWRQYVSESYWEANQPEQVAASADSSRNARPTPRPDGKPWIWYSDFAPDWYWEKLDAINYTGDTALELVNGWCNTYGEDSRFWPLEAQAIDYYWHEIYGLDSVSFPGLPSEADISQQVAEKLARSAFEKQYGDLLGEMELKMENLLCAVSYWFNQPYEGVNTWQLTFLTKTGAFVGMAQINAQTGEPEAMEGPGASGFMLINEPTPMPTPTPRPDGKPWMWNSDIAPASFWARLEVLMQEKGVTPENIGEWEEKWTQAYGDTMFWPLECQALSFTLSDLQPGDTIYMALPAEGGLTQEKAAEIAWEAFRQVCKDRSDVTEEWVDSLRISVSLIGNDLELGKNRWVIQFCETDPENDKHWVNTRGWVYLDEETGEVTLAELDLYSNG